MIWFALLLLSQSNGDTLRWYDTTTVGYQHIGLTLGGYLHWAIILPIGSEYEGRTVHSGRVHIWEAMDSSGTMRLCVGDHVHPISVLDSGTFHSTGYGFYEVSFGDSIVLHTWDTIWIWCTQWHAAGQEPATTDGGPCNVNYGFLCSLDGVHWESLCTSYFSYNWIMELILTPLDVKEGPASPHELFMTIVSSNPVKGNIKLQYGIPVEYEGLVSLKIYDVSGRAIKTIFSEEKSAGYYDLSVPTSSFSSGTYFLRMETETKSKTEKVVIR